MIKIDKSTNIPAVLINRSAIETSNLINIFNANPILYTSRTGVPVSEINKFTFEQNIYGHKTVKDQLKTEQHHKCCYCESKFEDNGFGDVEHFRPKGAYKKNGENKLTYPGYYWLAYDWNNLMVSCERCNQEFKKNHFPLNNETTRKRFHNDHKLLINEDRLLINPIEENPSIFFKFNDEIPVPIQNSLKGRKTIQFYGLERLNDSRLFHLQSVQRALAFIKIDETNVNQVTQASASLGGIPPNELIEIIISSKLLFNSAANNDSKYTYCVRCKFPQLPII